MHLASGLTYSMYPYTIAIVTGKIGIYVFTLRAKSLEGPTAESQVMIMEWLDLG